MQEAMITGFRLSPQQRQLWQVQEHQAGFLRRIQCSILIQGPLDKEQLRTALMHIVTRHEILRTAFRRWSGMTLPLQIVTKSQIAWQQDHDLSGLDAQAQSVAIAVLFNKLLTLPLNLEAGPTVTAWLVTMSDDQHTLLLSLPSLASDRASLQHLFSELSQTYVDCQNGKAPADLPVQYADVAEIFNELLESEETLPGRQYWRNLLSTSTHTTHLSAAGHASNQTGTKSAHTLTIPAGVTSQVVTLAEQQAISIRSVFLTCWQILLWRLTEQQEILVGLCSDGRTYEELQEAIGLFAKYLPLRCYLKTATSFVDMLQQNNEAVQQAVQWQEYFDRGSVCVNDSETLIPDYFPVCFEFFKQSPAFTIGDLTFTLDQQSINDDNFQIKLVCIHQDDVIHIELHYDTSRFADTDMVRIAEQFLTLLENVLLTPTMAISNFEILSATERQRLLITFNETETNYPATQCIGQLFEAQVARTPNRPAVMFEAQQLTFAELDSRANQLAHHLQSLGVKLETPVGLYVECTPELMVGILGVLKAGGTYIPLDPSYPPERLAYIVEDAQIKVLVAATTEQSLPQLSMAAGAAGGVAISGHQSSVVDLYTDWSAIAQQPTNRPPTQAMPDNLAYIIYTSGSTGRPKGAMITHKGVVNYLTWATDAYQVAQGEGAPVFSSISFDLTVTSLFAPLLTGRPVVLLPEAQSIETLSIALQQQEASFSFVKLTPSHLALLSQQLSSQELAGKTNVLILGGESLSAKDVHRWQTHDPATRLFNEYGPTEAVVGCCVYEVPKDISPNGDIPIGYPIANTQLYVLDDRLQPVAVGIPGELYIGGIGVARGYHQRPGLTAERFIPDPFSPKCGERLYKTGDWVRHRADGRLEYLGRRDHQVKIRGFRVELGEVEALLRQHPAVHEAVVSLHEPTPDNQQLLAHLQPDAGQASAIREILRRERDGTISAPQLYDLANGMSIVHHRKNETDYMFKEIFEEQTYLRNGVDLQPGACVIDIGCKHRSLHAVRRFYMPQ